MTSSEGLCTCHFGLRIRMNSSPFATSLGNGVATLQLIARRCKYYAFINAFICSVALGSYLSVSSVDSPATFVVAIYGASLLRILAMIKWFEWIATKKAQIHRDKRVQLTEGQSRSIYRRILWLVVPTECVSFWFAQQTAGGVGSSVDWRSFLMEYVWFVPKSLLFEVLFDFFHFAMHWGCHYSTWLYKNVHKRHHLHLHPCPLSTYEQDSVDLCLTNVLPFCLAWSMSFSFSALQLHLLFAYKTYVEVAGHSGLEIKGFSFPQMPLVNNIASICLRVHDHDLHHTHPRWNFAKRFSLWDRLFLTFRPGTPLTENYHEAIRQACLLTST